MSIQDEISRLEAAKAGIKAAIEAKGVSVSDEIKLDGYGAKIEEIQSGGYTKGDVIAAENLEYEFSDDPSKRLKSFYGYLEKNILPFCCCYMENPKIFATYSNKDGVYAEAFSIEGPKKIREMICSDLPTSAEVIEFDGNLILFGTKLVQSNYLEVYLSLVDFLNGSLLKTSTITLLYQESVNTNFYVHKDWNGNGYTIRGPKIKISESGSNEVCTIELVHLDENLQETHRVNVEFQGTDSSTYYYNTCFFYDSGYFYGLLQTASYNSSSGLCRINSTSGEIELLTEASEFSSRFNELVVFGNFLYIFCDNNIRYQYEWGGSFSKIERAISYCNNSSTTGLFYRNRYSICNGLLITRSLSDTFIAISPEGSQIDSLTVPDGVFVRELYRGRYNSNLLFFKESDNNDVIVTPPVVGYKVLEVSK